MALESESEPGRNRFTVRAYLIGLGVPALLFAVCFPLIGYWNFWVGVGGGGFAALWFGVDWFFLSRGQPTTRRITGIALAIAILGFIIWIAVEPHPLFVSIAPELGDFPVGTDRAGVKWKKEYSAADIFVTNDSNGDYKDIDIFVKTDLMIAEVGLAGEFTQCAASPTEQFGVGGVSIGIEDTAGKKSTIPGNLDAAANYRIHCNELLPGSNVEVVLALRNIRLPAQNETPIPGPYPLFLPPQAPKYVAVQTHYKAGEKPMEREAIFCKGSPNECEAMSKLHTGVVGFYHFNIPSAPH